MSKKKKWILFASIMVIASLTLWLSYDFHLKYVINNYQEKRIEKQLQVNFKSHLEDFEDLVTFSRELGTLENLEFYKTGIIRFDLRDSLLIDSLLSDTNIINVDDDELDVIENLRFTDSTLFIKSSESESTYKNWMIWYRGRIDNPSVEKLLAYNQITLEQLSQLKNKLDKIKCEAFSKTDSLLTIRYAGHSGECFNYIVPLKPIKISDEWVKLADNYYWEHYRNGLFCGWSDWSWNE